MKNALSLNKKPDEDSWYELYDLNNWYKEHVDPEAKRANNCKVIWDKLTTAQKNAFRKECIGDEAGEYSVTCDTYNKTRFMPAKAFCINRYDNNFKEYNPKDAKSWGKVEMTEHWLFTFVLRDRTCYDA